VEEVAGADGAEFPGAEAARQGQRAEQSLDDAGVVVGLAEEALTPAVAGEQEGGVGLGAGEEVAQVLVGEPASRTWNWTVRPTATLSPTAMAPLRWSAPTTPRTRKSPRLNSSRVSSTTQPIWSPRRMSSRSSSLAAVAVSCSRWRAGFPPNSRMKFRSDLVTT